MRDHIFFLAVGLSAILHVSMASAEEAAGSGAGVDTRCSEYTELGRTDSQAAHFAFVSWAQGFMTGFNFARLKAGQKPVDLKPMDQNEVEAYLRKECAANPAKPFLSVVIDLYLNLAERSKVAL